jgi:hypothetical protein
LDLCLAATATALLGYLFLSFFILLVRVRPGLVKRVYNHQKSRLKTRCELPSIRVVSEKLVGCELDGENGVCCTGGGSVGRVLAEDESSEDGNQSNIIHKIIIAYSPGSSSLLLREQQTR